MWRISITLSPPDGRASRHRPPVILPGPEQPPHGEVIPIRASDRLGPHALSGAASSDESVALKREMRAGVEQSLKQASFVEGAGRAGKRVARWLDRVDFGKRDLGSERSDPGVESVGRDAVCGSVESPEHQHGCGKKDCEDGSDPDDESDPGVALRNESSGRSLSRFQAAEILLGGARRSGVEWFSE